MSVLLVAVKPLTYEGRPVAVGEVFAVRRPIDAAALTHQRKATYAPKDAGKRLSHRQLSPDESDDAPKKRRYRRRDLSAEQP